MIAADLVRGKSRLSNAPEFLADTENLKVK